MTASDLSVTETSTLTTDVSKLPIGVFKAYGCQTCEWRSTDDCPIKAGVVLPGICDKRKEFLLSLTQHYDKMPTMDRWQRDVTLLLQHNQYLADNRALGKLEKEIKLALDSGLDKKAGILQKSYNRLREQCHLNWTNVTKFNDMKVARDTPKKLEVTHEVKIRPSDIAKKIREARFVGSQQTRPKDEGHPSTRVIEAEVIRGTDKEGNIDGKDKISSEQEKD